MTLTSRLTVFFLAALAVLLAGFSTALYLLASTYLHRQVEDRLEASLNILAAAAEVNPHGIEWEAHNRTLSLDADSEQSAVCWVVCNERGRIIDHSKTAGVVLRQDQSGRQVIDAEGLPWRISRRRLESGLDKSRHDESIMLPLHSTLVLIAALPLQPVHAALRELAAVLIGLSLGLWLLAVFGSRWLCRRALAPVTRMASAARAMRAADLGQRLPIAATGDELQDLGQAFNDLLARLHESFERQARFTGDASHQLRTPLTALLGQIEIALRRPRAATEYQHALTVLHGQAVQLHQIVDSLLFLARADAEAQSPCLDRLDLRAWLPEHLATWSSHARAADFRLETPGDSPLWVQTQTPLLRQLLDNLLENACKYSTAGTPVTIGLAEEAGMVSLTVTDAGCGIAGEDLSHIFEPFYRSTEARRQGVSGIGLGLAVAQRIALALGGTLRVHSQPEKGTRFTLHIPEMNRPGFLR